MVDFRKFAAQSAAKRQLGLPFDEAAFFEAPAVQAYLGTDKKLGVDDLSEDRARRLRRHHELDRRPGPRELQQQAPHNVRTGRFWEIDLDWRSRRAECAFADCLRDLHGSCRLRAAAQAHGGRCQHDVSSGAPRGLQGPRREAAFLEARKRREEASLPFCGTLHKLFYRPIINKKRRRSSAGRNEKPSTESTTY